MKKLMILLLITVPLLTACTANVIGKFDDYNEIFSGTIDLDLMGHGIIKVKSTPSNITCKGKGWVTFIPASSYWLGTCKGQRGEAELTCDDGRTVTGDWVCEACTRVRGEGKTNLNENITFFITPSKKRLEKVTEEYKNDTAEKPNIRGKKSSNGSVMEGLF